MSKPRVIAVARDAAHGFSKAVVPEIRILDGLGVEGDAHAGATVRHRSRVAVDPSQPNLRQVHLIHAELFDDLAAKGFDLRPGDLGENVTTAGVDLLGLPRGTRLRIGATVVLEVTGLRNPCHQIDAFRPGLLSAVLLKGPQGALIRKTGVMSVVRRGGVVAAGDPVVTVLPERPHLPLERV